MANSKKRFFRKLALGAAATLAGGAAFLYALAFPSLGKAPSGARRARIEKSPQFRDGRFENPEPLENHFGEMLLGLFDASPHVSPDAPLAIEKHRTEDFLAPPESGVRVTWFGHSSTLVEVDGHRVLTDPVWSERASPISFLGPKRFAEVSISIEDLPPLDAVVISHDHYDHLDRETILRLDARKANFVVPLGVGAHLEDWGVPPERIFELDWWESADFGSLRVTCTPARHASGRQLFDKDRTLWAGYALLGEKHRVYYSGDTGLFSAMKEIGRRLGPFDLTMIETGQYNHAWPDWHIGPEQAVLAHEWVRGKTMLPVHWALFGLAYHGWTEPVERSLIAAEERKATLVTPALGKSIEPASAEKKHRWWPHLPFQTGAEAPIFSTKVTR